MSDTAGEKTFAPSAKRKQDAAQKGDVLRSRELGTAAAILVGAAWLKLAGPWVLHGLDDVMHAGFTWDRATIDSFDPGGLMLQLTLLVLPPILVLGAVVLLLVRTTERTFYGDGVVHSTDGWQPWSTSLLVLGLVALTVAVACALVPAGSTPTRTP